MATIYNIGSKGDGVRNLQTKLKNAGFDPGGIDGIYGKNTAAAVTEYQKANKLKVDGIAGPQTLGSLSSSIKPVTPKTPVETPNTPDITGLTELRDYGTGNGLNIGGTKETVPVVKNTTTDTTAPGPFENPFDEQTMAALEKYLNPTPFTYNPATDPAYQSYANMYIKAGDRAFQDTIGDLSALTGGRVNSWATSAASQARNDYIQDLNNIIPVLEEKAYGRHRDFYDDLYNQLQILQDMGATEYGKYRDTVGDFRTDRAFNRNVFESDRAFDYQVGRDKVLDDQWMKQFDYQKQQDIIRNALQNRQISVSEANAALNRAQFNYQKERDKKDETDSTMPSPGQLSYYNQIKDAFMNNDKTPSENLSYMERLGKEYYTNLMGEKLYNQLVSDLQAATQPQMKEPIIPAKEEARGYEGYIESNIIPKGTLGNAMVDDTTRNAIDNYLGQLQSNGVNQDILIYLANKYGIPVIYE